MSKIDKAASACLERSLRARTLIRAQALLSPLSARRFREDKTLRAAEWTIRDSLRDMEVSAGQDAAALALLGVNEELRVKMAEALTEGYAAENSGVDYLLSYNGVYGIREDGNSLKKEIVAKFKKVVGRDPVQSFWGRVYASEEKLKVSSQLVGVAQSLLMQAYCSHVSDFISARYLHGDGVPSHLESALATLTSAVNYHANQVILQAVNAGHFRATTYPNVFELLPEIYDYSFEPSAVDSVHAPSEAALRDTLIQACKRFSY